MHLEARERQTVSWQGGSRRFEAGERIHTENSYKYRQSDAVGLLEQAGFAAAGVWTDPARLVRRDPCARDVPWRECTEEATAMGASEQRRPCEFEQVRQRSLRWPSRCRPRTAAPSRCRTPARSSGTWRIPPGSSRPSSSSRASRLRPFHPAFRVLFNSYYNGVGDKHPRAQRGLLTRPPSTRCWPTAPTSTAHRAPAAGCDPQDAASWRRWWSSGCSTSSSTRN
jgi:hypothetical protein